MAEKLAERPSLVTFCGGASKPCSPRQKLLAPHGSATRRPCGPMALCPLGSDCHSTGSQSGAQTPRHLRLRGLRGELCALDWMALELSVQGTSFSDCGHHCISCWWPRGVQCRAQLPVHSSRGHFLGAVLLPPQGMTSLRPTDSQCPEHCGSCSLLLCSACSINVSTISATTAERCVS